jgi:tricorn protease-like protein/C-terminal processing protease CtpA/Prc
MKRSASSTQHTMRAAVTLLAAGAVVAVGNPALADGHEMASIRPDATMLQYPDVSQDSIVFVYANDLWKVPREGGAAMRIASPPGPESFPRFSPDGRTIAFVGNYEGNQDVYTIAAHGADIAHRVTHHPAPEFISDWTPDGERLLIAARQVYGPPQHRNLFFVDADGGLPEKLPLPYGAFGSLNDDGTKIVYIPHSRDFATWKRYRGGQATDLWIFDLENHTSKRITDWEGSDTQPMWHGDRIYYLSDAGENARMNVWVYDTNTERHRQLTHFADFDVKWPAIGPGDDGQGEIVFQNGAHLYLLDLRTMQSRLVDVVIPGDRPTLRKKMVDYSDYVMGGGISNTGKRAVVEARGDIWSVPAEKGITRNLTQTSGIAERSPIWSPDGQWIAYLSDETGEYEIYVTQSDGRGETKQLTEHGECFRYLLNWSPDSKYICFADKTGSTYLLEVETQEITFVDKSPDGQFRDVSWSHDSMWITYSRMHDEANNPVVCLYDIENAEHHIVTSPMFPASSPTFDAKGEFLYYASQLNFSPTYSSVQSTFIYDDAGVLMAVPLNGDVENPWLDESDEEEWEEEKADTEEDAEGEDADAENGDDAEDGDEPNGDEENADEDSEEGDEAENADEDADEDSDEAPAEDLYNTEHPLHGVWEGSFSGMSAIGAPEDSGTLKMTILVMKDGTITGTSTTEFMGQSETDDLGTVTFDEGSGELRIEDSEDGVTSIMTGKLEGDTITGTWEIVELGISGPWSATKTDEEISEEDAASGEDAEPVVIDLEGFESRAMQLPVAPGGFRNLAVNDKNQLLYVRTNGGMPSIKLFDMTKPDDGEKNVLGGAFGFDISSDGKKLLVGGQGGYAIVSAAPGQSMSKRLPDDRMKGMVDPRAEWRQIFHDAWRIQRDFFYVANMHGVDWEGIRRRYGAMIEDCVTREDVSYVISEMISELNIGHAYYFGGDGEGGGPSVNVGMLGCDFELIETEEGTAYQITKIYTGGPWDADARGPLSQHGIDVKEGDFLLAVNGMPVDIERDPWASFIGTAGEMTEITVSEKPVIDDDARRFLIEPMRGEAGLRFRGWIEHNRKYVAEKSGGRIGYIYVRDTGISGQSDLIRQFFGQRHLDGLIIDERWNGGGQLPHRFVELLDRPLTNYWALRDGRPWYSPSDAHHGPKAMLINGLAGSGGDMFPRLFKQAGLGPLIGTRTWGGLVGISGNPALIDGGYTSVPRFAYFDLDGTWGIEGHGVDPDIEVIDDPALMVDGSDPQLDKAIQVVLEEIERNPPKRPVVPPAPDRSGIGITEEDK